MMSEIGKEMLQYQSWLAETYGYKPIEPNFFEGDVRQKFRDNLPDWCNMSGDDVPLFTHEGTLIANGYRAIVIGDYGAFIEIAPEQMVKDAIVVERGQEYRIFDPQYREHCKYHWYTAKDNSHVKLYFQQKTVDYADYKVGMWYVSPYEITVS